MSPIGPGWFLLFQREHPPVAAASAQYLHDRQLLQLLTLLLADE